MDIDVANLILKMLLVLSIFGLIGLYKGLKGEIVVYTNFTDAALSLAGIWGAIAIYIALNIILKWFFGLEDEWVDTFNKSVFYLVFSVALLLSIRTSHRANNNFKDRFYSIAIKVSTSIIYAFFVIVFLLLTFMGEGKRENETSLERYHRLKRNEENSAAAKQNLLIATLLATYLGYKLSTQKKFITMQEYLDFKGFSEAEINTYMQEESTRMAEIKGMIPNTWWTNWALKY